MTGLSRFSLGDGPKSIVGRFPPLNAVALGDLFDLLYETITSVRTDAPGLIPDAERLDRLTSPSGSNGRTSTTTRDCSSPCSSAG